MSSFDPIGYFLGSRRGTGGSGATLNIAYGENAPSDTSKLWVKTAEPTNVSLTPNVEGTERMSFGVGSLPSKICKMGTAHVGNKVYFFGGYNGSAMLNTIWAFDLDTGITETLDVVLPKPIEEMGTSVFGNKVYLFGGRTGSSSSSTSFSKNIYEFDCETNTLTTLSVTLPIGLYNMGTAVIRNYVYLFGGYYYKSGANEYANKIYKYNIETQIITTLPITLPQPNAYMSTGVIGNEVYIFGGFYSGSALDTIILFDSENDTLTTLDTVLPTPLRSMGISCVGNKVYLFGGSPATSTVMSFDTETQSIETLDASLPNKYAGIGTAVKGNKVYLFGGWDLQSTYYNLIHSFIVSFPLATGDIQIQTGMFENTFPLIISDSATLEVGVKGVYVGNADGVAENGEAYLYNGTEWRLI